MCRRHCRRRDYCYEPLQEARSELAASVCRHMLSMAHLSVVSACVYVRMWCVRVRACVCVRAYVVLCVCGRVCIGVWRRIKASFPQGRRHVGHVRFQPQPRPARRVRLTCARSSADSRAALFTPESVIHSFMHACFHAFIHSSFLSAVGQSARHSLAMGEARRRSSRHSTPVAVLVWQPHGWAGGHAGWLAGVILSSRACLTTATVAAITTTVSCSCCQALGEAGIRSIGCCCAAGCVCHCVLTHGVVVVSTH
jgi:hypothetical protein